MSRLTKKPVVLPEGVTLRQEGNTLTLQGPKGTLSLSLLAGVTLKQEENKAFFSGESAKTGTMWSHTRNAAEGVSQGFTKVLEIEGVGFKAALEGKTLVLNLGFVNPIRFPIPEGITITVEKGSMKVSGVNKELVGGVASRIRGLKPPEPYKGKGIHYQGEVIRRKAGKKAAAASGAA
ncbi:MAG: 50S ribosomal protein L6 [Candidatus Liptonbacteria bacterium]|nr:50S ribosomal protein L6 [Candidatus Liptonbacteria bacterium]